MYTRPIPEENQVYAHYKRGMSNRVLRIVQHGHKNSFSESVVVYQNIQTKQIWYRVVSDFLGIDVDIDGDTFEKFKLVDVIFTGKRAKAPRFNDGDVGGCGFNRLETIAGL